MLDTYVSILMYMVLLPREAQNHLHVLMYASYYSMAYSSR